MNRDVALLEFWDVVDDCLVTFHRKSESEAHRLVTNYRSALKGVPLDVRDAAATLVYHEQPFYVACDLAHKELDLSEYLPKYKVVLERHGW